MRELEFRHALRNEMAQVTRPEPMNETEVLAAARRALRRRRAAWVSAGSAVAVMALAVGTVFIASADSPPGPAADADVTSTTQPDDDGLFVPQPEAPAPYTYATSGPHYEQSVTLLNLMVEAVPPGFDVPADITLPAGNSVRDHSANTGGAPGRQWWEYLAVVPIAKEGRFGRLLALVHTPGNDLPPVQGCQLAIAETGDHPCQEVLVDGVRVGVTTPGPNEHGAGSQVAVYRHRDGTMVHIEQNDSMSIPSDPNHPPLTELPLTPRQLAEVAADPRFHLS
jgi:hypothetical protein